jgi:glycosyltransferase involved in cell wall biosynthesis
MNNTNIEVSVVLPCLNEEAAIGTCIKKIKEVFSRDRLKGEIIVADNGSTDRSREIAQSEGAKVFFEPQGGYGAAYLCGLKEASGKYIAIGDSDNSYDFSELPKFLGPLQEGYDFVIGSRFKGKMQAQAMPWLHRYVGNPLLSGVCRLFFRTQLSDIHCGMRAFSASAYRKMKLRTLGMEFATEMVVSALQNNLKICEVPINYHRRKGRSKLNPFSDAWRHIRFMLLYCPSWLYFIPGVIGLSAGMLLLLLLLRGPLILFGRSWDMHLLVFVSGIAILSYQLINLGVFAHTFAVNEKFLKQDKLMGFLQEHFSLERGILLGGVFFLGGFFLNLFIFLEWFSRNFGTLYRIRESILAITLLVIGLQTIFSSFFISLLFLKRR